jgi:predicted Zn-dependent protease
MSRPVFHLSALAAGIMIPLAAACWDRSATESASSSASSSASAAVTTASTGAETPATAPAPTGSVTQPGSLVVGTVTPTYADAERAFQRGRYEEAATMFEAYSESNPDNAWGQYMLGLSAWKTGDHTRALEAFDAALRLDPTHRKSLLNSARVLLETSRPKDALERVEQALAIEPLSGEGLRLLGRARHELGDVAQAIDAYQRAIALDDRDVWAMNNLGFTYIQQGRSDAALLPLARAVELRGNVPVFQNNFGTALERSGHFVAARQAYEKALEADSTYSKAAVGLARVNARGTESDTSSVDVAALARGFQGEVEQWRTWAVTPDTTTAADSVGATGMARDSVGQ